MATAEEVALYYPLPTDEWLHTELERLQADFQAFQDLIASSRGQDQGGRDCDCLDNDDDDDNDENMPCPIHGNRVQPEDNGGDMSDAGLRAALDMLTQRAQAMLDAQEACDCPGRPGTAAEAAAAGTDTAVETAAAGTGTDTGTRSIAVSPVAPPPPPPPPVQGDTQAAAAAEGDERRKTATVTQGVVQPGPSNTDDDPLAQMISDLEGGFANPDDSVLGGDDPFGLSVVDTTLGVGDDSDDGGDDGGHV